MSDSGQALVGICMGSDSDWPTMEAASAVLDEFGVPHRVDVVSAHRMPEEMLEYGKAARALGLGVIIAGAGVIHHAVETNRQSTVIITFGRSEVDVVEYAACTDRVR